MTSQYVDLNARLSNSRNTEKRLTDLLRQRTGELAYVLQVELEIDRVRGEIEQMEAERKNLAHQVNFATISATVTEDYQAQLQIVPLSTSTRFRNAAVSGYRTMADGVVEERELDTTIPKLEAVIQECASLKYWLEHLRRQKKGKSKR